MENNPEITNLSENSTSSEAFSLEKSQSFWSKWLVPLLIILGVLLIDQTLKIWVKTSMNLSQEKKIFGEWFLLHFTENPGMAFGLEIGGKYGKLALTLFRMVAVVFGFWVLWYQISKKSHKGFIACIALILAGAIGNIIDSIFYGVIFEDINRYSGGWFYGWVVDMLYLPLIEGYYPEWIPWKGGDYFIFFSPVFNIADTAISIGVFVILVFQKKFFPKPPPVAPQVAEEEAGLESDTLQQEKEKEEL